MNVNDDETRVDTRVFVKVVLKIVYDCGCTCICYGRKEWNVTFTAEFFVLNEDNASGCSLGAERGRFYILFEAKSVVLTDRVFWRVLEKYEDKRIECWILQVYLLFMWTERVCTRL